MTRPDFEVVVIGGGAIGTNVAYHLADGGIDVALFEANQLGKGSTGRSAGGIRQQFSSERKIRLAIRSRKLFEEYAADSNSFELEETGYLFLAQTEEQLEGFETDATLQRNLGLNIDLLSPEECTRFVPDLLTADLEGGKYCPAGCVTGPTAVTRWLGEQAAAIGAKISEDEPVTEVRTQAGDVTGIETTDRAYTCNTVVNAAGVWAPAITETVGSSVPITPSRIQLIHTETSQIPSEAPFVVDINERRYFRPANGGKKTIFGGANIHDDTPAEPKSYETDYDEAFVDQTVSFAEKRLRNPSITVADGWSGLKGLTPDGDPLIGEISDVSNFYLAAGCNGHGFMLAPAIGQALATTLIDGTGEAVDPDLASFDPDRFSDEPTTKNAGFMDVS